MDYEGDYAVNAALATTSNATGNAPTFRTCSMKDRDAAKNGPHHTVFGVRPNPKHYEDLRLGKHKLAFPFTGGEQYTGDWLDNKKHGFGSMTMVSGDKYEGEWQANRRDGKGTHWVKKGKRLRKEYAGDWRHDKRHGLGIFYYQNGDKYEGEWANDRRHGRGKMAYASGEVYEGDWSSDLRSGLGVLTLANGDRYEGHWLDDQKEGPGRYFYLSTLKVYEGEWSTGTARCGVYKDMENAAFDAQYSGASEGFELPSLGLADSEAVVGQAVATVRQARTQEASLEEESGVDGPAADRQFTEAELAMMRTEFGELSANGLLPCHDLIELFRRLGMAPLESEVDSLLSVINAELTTEITFAEFVDIMALLSS
jgi:hypothetical protein